MRIALTSLVFLLVLVACSEGERQAEEMELSSADATRVTAASGSPLGSVWLAGECADAAELPLARGLALLHSMTYEEAEAAFAAATEADPDCAMGYWGQAMSIVHPLWSDPPSEARFEHGRSLLGQARATAESDHELAYVDALAAYYEAGRGESEKPNLVGYENGWRAFHAKYPDDPEGTAFYALAQLATVDPGDKTFSKQRAAGAMAAQVLAEIPDHPGAHHYIIHAYDNPALSEQAADVAREYGGIAPDIPHALHMPTHTFTRLGLWQESIEGNRRSADAAVKRPVGGQPHYLHALDYLAYAYLQGAEDQKALAVLEEMQAITPPYTPHIASAYTLAAVPARLALERQLWETAAALEPRRPAEYPWETAAPAEAITYFARALGAARSGRLEQARADLEALSAIEERIPDTGPYDWRAQVRIQRLGALAWLQLAEGARDQALATMRQAAELEARTEKHPVTPGEVLPARELLADLLLELDRPAEALVEYEVALDRSPNRFNSLYGAARSAELAGDPAEAREYYEALVAVSASADTERERLRQARAYLAREDGSAS